MINRANSAFKLILDEYTKTATIKNTPEDTPM